MTKDYAVVTTVEQLARLADKLVADDKPVGFDLETGYYGEDFPKRSVDHYNDKQFVTGFSFTNDESWARYVPLAHDDGYNIDGGVAAAWDAVKPMLTKCHLVGHNLKFERAAVRKACGVVIGAEREFTDTILLAFVAAVAYKPHWRTMVALKELVAELLGHQMMHIEELWPNMPKKNQPFLRFNTLSARDPLVYSYACEDAVYVLPLRDYLLPIAVGERDFMTKLEHKIMCIVEEMELQGVSADWAALNEAYAEAQLFLPKMTERVKHDLGEVAGRDLTDLNLNSPKQLKELLFRDIGMKTTRLTAKGADNESMEMWQRMSSDKKALVALANEYPAVKSLLESRAVKNLSDRLKAWTQTYSHSYDGKVHPNYKQAGAESSSNDDTETAPGSGRFAASDPPIQQLPKQGWFWYATEKGKNKEGTNGFDYWTGKFRNFVVASPGTYLLTFDYSQVELRILAGASQEPALLEGFAEDKDMHTLTAAMMLGKSPFDIDPDTERPIGKTFNFALMYGMGPKSLSEQLGKSLDEAKVLYNQYFKVFSNVANWMDEARKIGFRQGYAETIFGRKIPAWELRSGSPGIKAKGARILVNGPIQGSAADYMKIAMVRAYTSLVKEGLWRNGCTLIMNQHDALTFEVNNDIDPNYIRDLLQSRVVFGAETIPILKPYPKIRADWEIGQRWGSATPWSFDRKAVQQDGLWIVEPEKPLARVSLQLPADPTEDQFRAFVRDLKAAQGDTVIDFSCPGGSTTLPFTSEVTESKAKGLKNLFKDAILTTSY